MAKRSAPRPAAQPAFLDTHAAAQLLGLRFGTLNRGRWAATGPQFRRHGGRVVYAVADLLAWSEAQVRTSTRKPGPEVAEVQR